MKTKISNFLMLVCHFSSEVVSGFLFSVRNQKILKIQIGPKMAHHHPKEQKKTSRVTLGTFFGRPNPAVGKNSWRFM